MERRRRCRRDETAQMTRGGHEQVDMGRHGVDTYARETSPCATRGRASARMVPRAIHVPCGADGVRREKGKSECASDYPREVRPASRRHGSGTAASGPPSDAPTGARGTRDDWSCRVPEKLETSLIEPAVRSPGTSLEAVLLEASPRRATHRRTAGPESSGARRHRAEVNICEARGGVARPEKTTALRVSRRPAAARSGKRAP
jgi:hypothetical protein